MSDQREHLLRGLVGDGADLAALYSTNVHFNRAIGNLAVMLPHMVKGLAEAAVEAAADDEQRMRVIRESGPRLEARDPKDCDHPGPHAMIGNVCVQPQAARSDRSPT
jgi:hypothetical protein